MEETVAFVYEFRNDNLVAAAMTKGLRPLRPSETGVKRVRDNATEND